MLRWLNYRKEKSPRNKTVARQFQVIERRIKDGDKESRQLLALQNENVQNLENEIKILKTEAEEYEQALGKEMQKRNDMGLQLMKAEKELAKACEDLKKLQDEEKEFKKTCEDSEADVIVKGAESENNNNEIDYQR